MYLSSEIATTFDELTSEFFKKIISIQFSRAMTSARSENVEACLDMLEKVRSVFDTPSVSRLSALLDFRWVNPPEDSIRDDGDLMTILMQINVTLLLWRNLMILLKDDTRVDFKNDGEKKHISSFMSEFHRVFEEDPFTPESKKASESDLIELIMMGEKIILEGHCRAALALQEANYVQNRMRKIRSELTSRMNNEIQDPWMPF
jgi:hypothetical protein